MRALLLALVGLTVSTAAQPRPAPLTLAASLGPTEGGGAHVAGSITGQRGHLVGTARLSSNGIGQTVSDGLFGSVQDRATEWSAMVGYALPVAGRWQVTGATGVSAVRVLRYQAGPCADAFIFCVPGDARREALPVRLGLPLEVGVAGPVSGAFGMGVRAFVTVNPEETYGGAALELRLSPVRPPRLRGGGG